MTESNCIRVLIVDDHAVVRSGLVAFLMAFDDLELVGEAANGKQAFDQCAQLHPDVVLMDLLMPDMDGAAATRTIRDQYPHIQVIALTSFREEALVQSVLQAGAIGYLLKSITADELAAAIRAAHAGRFTLAPEVAQTLVQAMNHAPAPRYDLTSRERQVLALVVKGLNNVEIAERLMISRSTVKFYVSSIFAKLGVSSRVELVALVLQHHLAM